MDIKPTQRFRVTRNWLSEHQPNLFFFGFIDLLNFLKNNLNLKSKMIEIGSYMGESTMLFASTQIFDEIHVIEPHRGEEEFNQIFNYKWDEVINEYNINTRYYTDIIKLYNKYSYEINNNFQEKYFDFIYIDGNHKKESVLLDLELYLPKLKKGGFIGGHDFTNIWPDVKEAIIQKIGNPDIMFEDTSWIKKI